MGTEAVVVVRDNYHQDAVTIGSDGHRAWFDIVEHCSQWKVKRNDDDPPPEPGTAAEWVDTFLERVTTYPGPAATRAQRGDVGTAGREFVYVVTLDRGEVDTVEMWRRIPPYGAGAGRRNGHATVDGPHMLQWTFTPSYTGDWTPETIAGNG